MSWTCSICLDSNCKNVVTLEPCMHRFHSQCIIQSLRINGHRCPYCRGVDQRNPEYRNNIQIRTRQNYRIRQNFINTLVPINSNDFYSTGHQEFDDDDDINYIFPNALDFA